MVPISKSIWPFILFVYLNLHFILMVRFNLFYCFSKIFFRERSKASPPNFAPSFCALCLNVCNFLPKTWNFGRKTHSRQRARPLRHGLRRATLPLLSLRDIFPRSGGSLSSKGEALAKPETLRFSRKLCRYAKGSPFGRAVTEGD